MCRIILPRLPRHFSRPRFGDLIVPFTQGRGYSHLQAAQRRRYDEKRWRDVCEIRRFEKQKKAAGDRLEKGG